MNLYVMFLLSFWMKQEMNHFFNCQRKIIIIKLFSKINLKTNLDPRT